MGFALGQKTKEALLASARSGEVGALVSRAVAAQGSAHASSDLRKHLEVPWGWAGRAGLVRRLSSCKALTGCGAARASDQAVKVEVPLTPEQLRELSDALAILAAPSAVARERESLETLKVDRQEFAKVVLAAAVPGRWRVSHAAGLVERR